MHFEAWWEASDYSEEPKVNAFAAVMCEPASDILVTLIHPEDPRTMDYALMRVYNCRTGLVR